MRMVEKPVTPEIRYGAAFEAVSIPAIQGAYLTNAQVSLGHLGVSTDIGITRNHASHIRTTIDCNKTFQTKHFRDFHTALLS